MPYFLAIWAVASWLPPTSEVTSTSGMRLSASRCFCPNAPCPATQTFISFLRTHRVYLDLVIASAAKQSRYSDSGLLRRFAPRNDDQPRMRSTFARAAARLSLAGERFDLTADLRPLPRARFAKIM